MRHFFGVTPEAGVFPGQGWAIEEIHAITHTGTHVNAPYHYGARAKGSRPQIDQVPLEWCFARGVVIDVRHIPAGTLMTVPDLEQGCSQIDYRLRSGRDRAVETGADRTAGNAEYFAQPGLDRGYEPFDLRIALPDEK